MALAAQKGSGLANPVAVVRQPGQRAGRGRVKPPGFGGLMRTGRSARLMEDDGDGMGQGLGVSPIPEPEALPEAWVFIAPGAGPGHRGR